MSRGRGISAAKLRRYLAQDGAGELFGAVIDRAVHDNDIPDGLLEQLASEEPPNLTRSACGHPVPRDAGRVRRVLTPSQRQRRIERSRAWRDAKRRGTPAS